MAEYLMKEACKKNNLPIEVSSRGLYPEEEVSPYIALALGDEKVRQYVPKALTQNHTDLVLAMTTRIKVGIITKYPDIRENLQKVYAFKELLGYTDKNIEDPLFSQFIFYGGRLYLNPNLDDAVDSYESCKNEINECVEKFVAVHKNLILPKNDLCKIIRGACKKNEKRIL